MPPCLDYPTWRSLEAAAADMYWCQISCWRYLGSQGRHFRDPRYDHRSARYELVHCSSAPRMAGLQECAQILGNWQHNYLLRAIVRILRCSSSHEYTALYVSTKRVHAAGDRRASELCYFGQVLMLVHIMCAEYRLIEAEQDPRIVPEGRVSGMSPEEIALMVYTSTQRIGDSPPVELDRSVLVRYPLWCFCGFQILAS